MNNLKELIEDFIKYTKTISISECEWFWNIDGVRKSNNINNKHITKEEFERTIREMLLYEFIYDTYSIKNQLVNDFYQYATNSKEHEYIKEIYVKIKNIFKDFIIEELENK